MRGGPAPRSRQAHPWERRRAGAPIQVARFVNVCAVPRGRGRPHLPRIGNLTIWLELRPPTEDVPGLVVRTVHVWRPRHSRRLHSLKHLKRGWCSGFKLHLRYRAPGGKSPTASLHHCCSDVFELPFGDRPCGRENAGLLQHRHVISRCRLQLAGLANPHFVCERSSQLPRRPRFARHGSSQFRNAVSRPSLDPQMR
jgi:hypothetical protein